MKISPRIKNLHVRIAELISQNRPAVLATIIDAKGSTPQVPGASAIFTAEGLEFGTVGGGILEGDAEEQARGALAKKTSRLYAFALEADISSVDGAICGGEALIFLDAEPESNREAFLEVYKSLRRRCPGVLATIIQVQGQEQVLCTRSWFESRQGVLAVHEESFLPFKPEMEKQFFRKQPALIKSGTSSISWDGPGKFCFVEPVFPLPQLIIAGAGHIGQAVAHLGNRLDFEITVIDDRREYANADRLPDADHILVQDIGSALSELPVSNDSYIVIVTRGHRHDGEALKACIDKDVAYIGLIGSRTKLKLMRQQFLDSGWASPEQWDSVHAPIGLDINSKTVEEIAVSIAAQLVQIRSQVD